MKDEGVCRTTPAKSGLLKVHINTRQIKIYGICRFVWKIYLFCGLIHLTSFDSFVVMSVLMCDNNHLPAKIS